MDDIVPENFSQCAFDFDTLNLDTDPKEQPISPSQAVPQKRCSRCKKYQPATNDFFASNRSQPDGFQNQCKICHKEQWAEKHPPVPKVKAPPPTEKACNKCSKVKPNIEEFFRKQKRKNGTHGLSAVCTDCLIEYNHQYIKEHKEKIKETNNAYYAEHREEINSRSRRYHWENREHRLQYMRQYSETLKEKMGTYRKKYYQDNRKSILQKRKEYRDNNAESVKESKKRHVQTHRDRVRKYHRNYRATHGEQMRQYEKRYRYSHKEQIKVYSHRRRAHIKQIGGHFTAEDIRQKYKRQKGRCYYCHIKLVKYHVDHVIPITREGSSNDPWNLVLACPACNSSKKDKLLHEWDRGGRLF